MMGLEHIHNFDYIILLCADMARMRSFYEDVMGFSSEQDLESWVSFRVGSSLLTLRPRASYHGDMPSRSSAVQLAFRVPPSAVDECYAELVAKGVAMVSEPRDLPDWRHRALFFRDPEHNVIEIYAEY